ncbi:Large ribosomal subunit protein bL21m [Plasmodiophora brassicae]|uniref:Large ribosomal subunit protein bL21m n=2 Tax=Plasmodiophora brassicae TaxID=37360 RepID=A0A3P3YAP0_PLABS|nr:unnamed protein product [Plasmodiophora brassicae]
MFRLTLRRLRFSTEPAAQVAARVVHVDRLVAGSDPGTFTTGRRVAQPSVRVEHPMGASATRDDGRLFAVVNITGKQYKVTPGDLIMAPYMDGVDIGNRLAFQSVMLVCGRDFSVIGRPHVENATVHASVQEQTQTNKVIVFKKKRRKGYRRTHGHRSDVTIVKIDSIEFDRGAEGASHAEGEAGQ